MKKLAQVRMRSGQIFPSPRENETMLETPPVLCWLKEEGVSRYTALVRDGRGEIVWQGETERNFIIPCALSSGEYAWNVSAGGSERGWVRFKIAENAVRIERKSAKEVLDSVPDCRPRHLFCKGDVENIVTQRPEAIETLRRNIALAIKQGMPQPPMFHRDESALPYREYFGKHREFCDRNLVACALGHALLGDEAAGKYAKALLLTLCDWNSEGPCSLEGPWGDEIGLSHARCLPAAFDLCYDLLDEKERIFVARTVVAYAMQCERRLNRLDFCSNPGESHAGRLPAYLGEAAMALKGTGAVEEEVLLRWLGIAIDVYGGIFPYFGGPDGGWAEGMFYASSYTKWFLPFFSALRRFSGLDFLKRPFYQRYARFLQHFCPPGWEIHPFGDGYWCHPDDEEWPGFFAQNPYRVYAERFGTDLLQKWSREAQKQEIFKLHLLDVFLPDGEAEPNSLAGPITRAQAFPDAGLVSLHTDPEHPEKDIALLARASRFGSVSHSHADQGSFALLCGGTALISPSGYFGRQYGTAHHRHWTNATRAHNTLLVDGVGQEEFSFRATGEVAFAKDENGALTAQIDPSGAYPGMQKWLRTFVLTDAELTVQDEIELNDPSEISYLLHALSRPEIDGNSMKIVRNGIALRIVPEEGGLFAPEIRDEFDTALNEGEPEQYHVQMPPQFHMRWKTPRSKTHLIRVRYKIG